MIFLRCFLHTWFLIWALLLVGSNQILSSSALEEEFAAVDETNTNEDNTSNDNNDNHNDEASPPEDDGNIEGFDDRTLLDTFGDVAKEFLTQKIIPETDAECKWDWRFVRCEPFCECDFLPRRGDYHLGRSCRKKEQSLEDDNSTGDICDPSQPTANPLQLVIQKTVRTSQKTAYSVSARAKTGYESLQTKVCSGLADRTCGNDEKDEKEDLVLAWQERLLCKNIIPDCPVTERESSQDVNKQQQEPDNIEEK